ncbi:sugar transferase [Streptococcus suis]|uniref:Sugar transferase n=1 Tax=Streptococcus suis TaxID=1307 RepID=A0A9X4MSA7_STRSU|nr:sugar transferase [Streptococcus suis]MDG4526179.1 sugar transferase [Streptococcus suis]MDG4528742.1 sugar transferase [Streptococcus suis]QZT18654.1 sugar transferase [Streptococcus suis]
MYERYLKRTLDVVLSFLALIVLSPVISIVAILVRLKLGTPIFFTQERPGKDEKIFKMYKFRTMTDEKDANGHLLPDSVRLTSFGKFLRSTSLDELPELWNILKGDMSIVGPRPLLIKYLPYYSEREKFRHSVRPGLTGLSQINGRNCLDWDTRLELDVRYSLNITMWTDIQILLKTVLKVVKREDVVVVDTGTIKDLDIERKNDYRNNV